jgi:serine phosphatase RsbU (regulator of sigma subunit)/CHASE3 domain sensor protein
MRLGLRWKIAGGFVVLLALIGILGWVTLSLFSSVRSVQRQVIDEATPQLVTVGEVVRSFTAQSAAVRGYVIGSQAALLDQYEREVAVTDSLEDRAGDLFEEGQEKDQVTGLFEAGHAFQDLVEAEVLPLVENTQRTQAIRILATQGAPLISQVETLGELLRDQLEAKVQESEAELQTNSSRFGVGIIVVLAAALTIGLGLAIALPRRLVLDLSELVDAARAIGRGDFDHKVEIHSGDEVEELAIRFTEMQGGLKRLRSLAMQDRELEIAAQIQRNLLQTIPVSPGVALNPFHRQANLVGGDWYDVDYTDTTLTVAVGDASGKGIAAALMATVVLVVLRAERGLGASPRRIIERANQALIDATDPDSFTTMIYATLDTESGNVTWLNMGHPAPFILRKHISGEARGYYLEGPRNKALGWFDDPGFATALMELQAGDKVIFFTDGFIEAKSADGEVFGDQRFAEAILRFGHLDRDKLGDSLLATVEQFAAGKLDDDLTMLILEYEGDPAGGERS